MEVRGQQPPRPRELGIVRCQPDGELGELGSGARSTAGRGVPGGGLKASGGDRVRARRCEREMAGLLLDVRDRVRQRAVDGAALPDRRLLVANRGKQRMRETDAQIIELDDALPKCALKRGQHALPVAVGRRDEFHRRPGERGGRTSTSTVSAGSRDKRLAKSPRKLSGTRSARPAAGLVPVRRSSRPSSSA